MRFKVTTSETISKVFEVEAENEEKARALDSPFKELISLKTTGGEVNDVEEIE